MAINSTLAAGNTTITGNTTTTTLNSGNTAITGTLAAGNTIITGTANVSQGLTANTLTVSTNTATFGTTLYSVANGNVGIGTASPGFKLDVVTDGGPSIIRNTAYRAAAGQTSYAARFARGSVASPTVILNGDTIGTLEFYPYNGSNFGLQTASIRAEVNGTVTSNSIPTDIIFGIDSLGAAYDVSRERMRINQFGIGIGGAIPANGTGIRFPATQSASSDANTLDDYEEGTWTPVFGYSGGNGTMSATYANQFGYYTKVGNLVFIRADIRFTSFSKGSASGAPWIVGLPFTPQNNSGYGGALMQINPYQWPISSTPFGATRSDGTPAIQLARLVSNSVNANLDDPDGDSMLFFSGVYQT